MLNRFKLVLLNAVSGIETMPTVENALEEGKPAPKFPYNRPHFLQFSSDELHVSGDKSSRPIIVPRNVSLLPWNSGYAESVNAGKSRFNEDQACVYRNILEHLESGSQMSIQGAGHTPTLGLPYVYFGLFDGHAGTGAAVAAAKQLHHILQQRLMDVLDHLLPPLDVSESKIKSIVLAEKNITEDAIITGALEMAFEEMDKLIGEDKQKYDLRGGCTALVALFILGKLYVANAGDSRAVLCSSKHQPIAMSEDFTPERERNRVRKLALLKPELLNGLYTPLEYQRKLGTEDLGKRVLFRHPLMQGWAYKTVTPADLSLPVVSGEMKRSRVLSTIGVTRGFGDHELKAISTNVPIKPFLSAVPEVKSVSMSIGINESSVLVMGTDGLWDIVSNDKVSEIVQKNLNNHAISDKYRFTIAAQDLVVSSRGKLYPERGWRLDGGGSGTSDDISVFVIPLLPYKEEHHLWRQEYEAMQGIYEVGNEAEEGFGNLYLQASPINSENSNKKAFEEKEGNTMEVVIEDEN